MNIGDAKMYQKLKKKNRVILLLLFLCFFFFFLWGYTFYKYLNEQEKVKNTIVPSLSDDYFTNQLVLTQYQVEAEQQEEIYYKQWLTYHPEYQEIYIAEKEYYQNIVGSLKVPRLAQMPDYPNGCEAVSAVMLLNYYGIDISIEDYITNYLPMEEVYEKDGVRYGPNPSQAYAGDPKDPYRGWGTFAPVIFNSLQNLLKEEDNLEVKDLSNSKLSDLILEMPVLLWVTIDYEEATEVYEWLSYDGVKTYTYPKNAHVVVLVGVDKDNFYLNDPLKPEAVVKVDKETLEKSYNSMGRQAIGLFRPNFEEDIIAW